MELKAQDVYQMQHSAETLIRWFGESPVSNLTNLAPACFNLGINPKWDSEIQSFPPFTSKPWKSVNLSAAGLCKAFHRGALQCGGTFLQIVTADVSHARLKHFLQKLSMIVSLWVCMYSHTALLYSFREIVLGMFLLSSCKIYIYSMWQKKRLIF